MQAVAKEHSINASCILVAKENHVADEQAEHHIVSSKSILLPRLGHAALVRARVADLNGTEVNLPGETTKLVEDKVPKIDSDSMVCLRITTVMCLLAKDEQAKVQIAP